MRRRFILVLAVFLAAGLTLAQNPMADRAAQLNLWFSHSRHLEALQLECTFCHSRAMESASSNESLLPSKETCAICHEIDSKESCISCHPMPESAHRVEIEPRQIHFSHRLHLSIPDLSRQLRTALEDGSYPRSGMESFAGEIDLDNNCSGCHRGMDRVDYGESRNYPLMADCLVCHQTKSDPMSNCGTCHPGDGLMKPRDHQEEGFFDAHSSTEARLDIKQCRQCHAPRYNPCSQCH